MFSNKYLLLKKHEHLISTFKIIWKLQQNLNNVTNISEFWLVGEGCVKADWGQLQAASYKQVKLFNLYEPEISYLNISIIIVLTS